MIRPQFSLDLHDEMIVDNFAGGGGASTGIELALGRCVDIAINHDAEAVALHAANHPQTRHLIEDVFAVDPVKETGGRPVGLAWFSPDCKHFSKAKGGKPRSKKIRGLAWVVVKWAAAVRPRVIMLENVEEFQTWGPLRADGTPCPKRRGRTFAHWCARLRNLGYVVECRELRACDYGAPTIRKRLFIVARCDGRPIVWPDPTHGAPDSQGVKAGRLKPWRTAAECIDWSLPCPSIFERERPLAAATCRRIARGIMRYVVNNPRPFIVPLTHQGDSRTHALGAPLPTITAAHRGEHALVAPTIVTNTTGHPGAPADQPARTICAEGTHQVLVAPVLTEHANQKHNRSFDPQQQLRTQCAEVKGGHFALAQAFLAQHNNHQGKIPSTGRDVREPMSTITAKGCQQGVVTGCLVPRYGERPGQEPRALDVEQPSPTVVPTGNGGSLVSAHLTKFRTGSTGSECTDPVPTVTAGPKENPAGAPHALGMVAAHLTHFYTSNTCGGEGDPSNPLKTITAEGNHAAEVRAFLIKYYGNEKDAHNLEGPLGTVTTKDRFGIVTVDGEEYQIADIGLRMLAPRELYRAQGFPADYIIGDDGRAGLRLTKSAQVRMCGNSVCPPLAAALARANVPELSAWQKGERRTA